MLEHVLLMFIIIIIIISAKHVYEETEGTHDQMSAMELQHLVFVKHHKSIWA